MKPKVSVLTPVYNQRQFLGKCLQSVINQTFKNWEMIIIDDASSDGSWDIIETFHDERIKALRHEKNYGKSKLAETHNEALSMASGELVAILEGDDYWPDYRLMVQIKSFEDADIVLSHGLIAMVKDGVFSPCSFPLKFSASILKNEPVGSALKAFILGENFLLSQSVMIRKKALVKIGGFKQPPSLYLMDYPTWLELALVGKFAFLPKVLGFWRRHPGSITSMHNEDLWLGMTNYVKNFVDSNKERLKLSQVNLDRYIRNAGVYGYINLFKCAIVKDKKEAKILFKKLRERRRGISPVEIIKIIILRVALNFQIFKKFYKCYLKKRTSKYAPFFNL